MHESYGIKSTSELRRVRAEEERRRKRVAAMARVASAGKVRQS